MKIDLIKYVGGEECHAGLITLFCHILGLLASIALIAFLLSNTSSSMSEVLWSRLCLLNYRN